MKIKYYTNGKSEILLIKDNVGNIIKKGHYTMGNCLVDIITNDDLICDNEIIKIDKTTKQLTISFLDKCNDYLSNDIKATIETDLNFIFNKRYSYHNIFKENKLSQVYIFEDINDLLCLLLTHIYMQKLIYKRCKYCGELFATRYSKAKFCKRIATKSGKTCGYAYSLMINRKNKNIALK